MKNEIQKIKLYKYGFTLAEVLITLVVIGVIAAMTIPTLINKTQNQEFVSRLKKTYSTLAQVTTQIVADRGAPINWVTSTDDIYNLYKSKLINVKECGPDAGCFEQTRKLLNGSTLSDGWDTSSMHRKLIMSDGTQLMLGGASHDFSNSCESTGLGIFGCHNICQTFFVDVNGFVIVVVFFVALGLGDDVNFGADVFDGVDVVIGAVIIIDGICEFEVSRNDSRFQ